MCLKVSQIEVGSRVKLCRHAFAMSTDYPPQWHSEDIFEVTEFYTSHVHTGHGIAVLKPIKISRTTQERAEKLGNPDTVRLPVGHLEDGEERFSDLEID